MNKLTWHHWRLCKTKRKFWWVAKCFYELIAVLENLSPTLICERSKQNWRGRTLHILKDRIYWGSCQCHYKKKICELKSGLWLHKCSIEYLHHQQTTDPYVFIATKNFSDTELMRLSVNIRKSVAGRLPFSITFMSMFLGVRDEHKTKGNWILENIAYMVQ